MMQEQQCLTVLVQFVLVSPQSLCFAMVPLIPSAVNSRTKDGHRFGFRGTHISEFSEMQAHNTAAGSS